jgi:hypothetical protein
MENPAAFVIQSPLEEIESTQRVCVKHRSTGHVHEFEIRLYEGAWVIELEALTHPNPQCSVEPVQSQAAARRAAREFIKSHSIRRMSDEVDVTPRRRSSSY